MPKNEAETRYELIDSVLRDKGYRMPSRPLLLQDVLAMRWPICQKIK